MHREGLEPSRPRGPGHLKAGCPLSECHFADVWTRLVPVNAALIPVDGVLLLQGDNYAYDDVFDWAAQISLEVTLSGQPVAGAVEETSAPGVFAWRPAQLLEPGATYEVTGMVDNLAEVEHCGEDFAVGFEFTVGVGKIMPLPPPVVVASEAFVVSPHLGLEDLVCCEGAVPARRTVECESFLEYPEGACAAKEGHRSRRVTLDIMPQVDAATAGQLAYVVWIGNMRDSLGLNPQWARSFKGEFCHDIGTINLATGDVGWALMGCLGAAPLDQIGDVEIDPRAEITCTAPLQTCEIDWNEEAWDLDRCMPWPPESEPEAPTTGEPMSGSSQGSLESSAGEDDPVDQGCACDGGGQRRARGSRRCTRPALTESPPSLPRITPPSALQTRHLALSLAASAAVVCPGLSRSAAHGACGPHLPTVLCSAAMGRWRTTGTLAGAVALAGCGDVELTGTCFEGARLCPTDIVRSFAVEPAAMASADLDADGAVDMLLADPDSGLTIAWGHAQENTVVAADRAPVDVQVFVTDGAMVVFSLHTRPAELAQWRWTAGALAETGRWPLSGTPRSLAIGDLDLDGRVDAVVASAGPGSLTTLTHGLADIQLQEFGEVLNDVALHDLDGDGDLDAATVDLVTHSLHLLMSGPGGLGAPTQVATGPAPEQVAVAVNGDGTLAVVTGGRASDGVALHTIDPDGAAGAAWSFDVGLPALSGLGLAVADGDAAPWLLRPAGDDLLAFGITPDQAPPRLRLTEGPKVEAIQRNGQALLLADGEHAYHLELGRAPALVERWRLWSFAAASLASADLDLDGLADLVAVQTNVLGVVLRRADHQFALLPQPVLDVSAVAVLAADFTGDGAIDLAVAGEGGLQLALGAGGGYFDPVPPALGDRVFRLLASIDDAGAAALVLGVDDGDGEAGAAVLHFDASGTMIAEEAIALPGKVLAAAAGDLDGDSLADLVLVRGEDDARVSLFTARSLGSDGWAAPEVRAEGSALYAASTRALTLAQLDGDNRVDALLRGGKGVEVFLDIAGPAPVRVPSPSPGGAAMQLAAIVEVDGDGAPDLLFTTSQLAGVAYNRGEGHFDYEVAQVLSTSSAVAVAPLTDPPALFATDAAGLAMHALGDAPRLHQSRQYSLPGELAQVTAGDLDGDGYPDIIAGGSSLDPIRAGLTVAWGSADHRFDRGLTLDVTPADVVTADLDGRAGDELLVLRLTGDLDVYRVADGLLRIDHTQTVGAARSVVDMQAADRDGDGRLDLAVLLIRVAPEEPWPLELLELRGLGDGRLAAPTTVWTGLTSRPRGPRPGPGLAVADLDADGLADVALHTGADPQLTVAWGGAGVSTLELPTEALGAGDMDGDGRCELLVRVRDGEVAVVSLIGRRITPVATLEAGPGVRRLVTAEIDGVPPIDLVTAAFSSVNIYLGDPDGRFSSSGGVSASAFAAVDLDLDGRSDLVSVGGSRAKELRIRLSRNGAGL